MPYRLSQRLALALVPRLAAALIRLLGATLRYREVCAEEALPGTAFPGPTIFAFWHQALLLCAYRFRNHGIAILISQSFDGELIARTVERLGFKAVRGSSSRGGVPALREMAEAYAAGFRCVFTADGPKGPAMVAKSGPVQLAQLTGAAWVGTFHASADRAWVLNTWDRLVIPRPFATVTIVWPQHAPPALDQVQAALNQAVAMSRGSIPNASSPS